MSLLKNAEPLLLAEYTKAMRIHNEPAFLWWVPHILRKKSRFVSKVKSLMHKNNLKFGIVVPRNIKQALHNLINQMAILSGKMPSPRRWPM